MTAYVIFIRNETLNPDKLKDYAEIAQKAPTDKIKLVAAKTGRYKILEGPPAEAVVILGFPSWDDALEWYESPEYQEAIKHRHLGSDTRVALVEGVD